MLLGKMSDPWLLLIPTIHDNDDAKDNDGDSEGNDDGNSDGDYDGDGDIMMVRRRTAMTIVIMIMIRMMTKTMI